ncbi:MAG: exodeoxyribonuclease VII small subunit [Bacillota bacterium]|nr:exodeoxyribonuclease VII small subunit [Bacillota bacterium]
MTAKKNVKMSFEDALKKLEIIIEKMESEELSLEDSLRNFEEGMELTRHCRKLLTDAEYKVEILLQSGELVDFQEAGEA